MGLFIRKPFEALQAEANASGKKTLKRVLGPWSLVALAKDCLDMLDFNPNIGAGHVFWELKLQMHE